MAAHIVPLIKFVPLLFSMLEIQEKCWLFANEKI